VRVGDAHVSVFTQSPILTIIAQIDLRWCARRILFGRIYNIIAGAGVLFCRHRRRRRRRRWLRRRRLRFRCIIF